MRIAICIASMGAGGAERVVGHMAGHWARCGHELHVVTLADPADAPFYPLPAEVCLHQTGHTGVSRGIVSAMANNLKRIAVLRGVLRDIGPDMVISHVDAMNVLTGLALAGLGRPHIAVEHIHPPAHCIGWAWGALRTLSYGLADRVVVLTEATRQWMPPGVRQKTVVIPNPVILPDPVPDGERIRRFERTVLCVGRLATQKGFDRMITAFAQAGSGLGEWGVVILGEGAERERLVRLVAKSGLDGRVDMPGVVENPFGRYHADIFCLPSRYEGFPMALCEAMAAGLPVVAFDCPTGPGELIKRGHNGVLVPDGDISALADELTSLMTDGARRERLGAQARELAETYALPTVMGQWDLLVGECARCKKGTG